MSTLTLKIEYYGDDPFGNQDFVTVKQDLELDGVVKWEFLDNFFVVTYDGGNKLKAVPKHQVMTFEIN